MADASKVSAELRKIDKESKEAERALKEVNKSLKLDPTNEELVAEKMKLIEQEADRLKRKFELLTQAERDMKQQNTAAFDEAKMERYKTSMNQLQSGMIKAKAQMASIDAQRQQEADKAAAKEKEAAAEAVAMVNAKREAEQRLARELPAISPY